MQDEEEPPGTLDEAFLDRVFERAVALLEDGASPSAADLLEGREHLRAAVESLLRTARELVPVRPEALRPQALPEVRGFTLLSEIGRGGMGVVYLARQEALGGRRVALKVLPLSSGLSAKARQRFLDEAHALAHLRHAHVVTVHDVIAGETVCAYAMEWIDGASLAQVIDFAKARLASHSAEPTSAEVRGFLGAEGPAGAEPYAVLVCRIGIAIGRALAALHRAGLVHRDVKPSNILLRRDGTPLLSDFGLVHGAEAELTQAGQFVGTVAYASPEQLGGDPESLDARSDVYSLGMTLYHALALHLPFDGARSRAPRASTPAGMLHLIQSGRAAPLRSWNRRLPRDLETIVAKAIDADPERRYAGADELADDLERLLALQPIRARRAGPIVRVAKLVRRNRAAALGVFAGSALSLALAAAAVAYLLLAPPRVELHMREARLALIDPRFANSVFSSELWGSSLASVPVSPAGLSRALEQYDAALRWSPFDDEIRQEREVVARAAGRSSTSTPAGDERSAGLLAYLSGDLDGAIARWNAWESQRDPLTAPDPLVDAVLGVVYLVREEPARAYPRLRQACQAFPANRLLTTYLADSALQCGDFVAAEHLLAAAAGMPSSDLLGALERVEAKLYAATGRDDLAEELYRGAPPGSPHGLDYARFLEQRGRVDEAIDRYALAARTLRGARVQSECAAVLERWWASRSGEEQRRLIEEALQGEPHAPLLARLELYRTVTSSRALPPLTAHMARGSLFFATLSHRLSSPSAQSPDLKSLAEALEVDNMSNSWQSRALPLALERLLRPARLLSLPRTTPGLAFALLASGPVGTAQSIGLPQGFCSEVVLDDSVLTRGTGLAVSAEGQLFVADWGPNAPSTTSLVVLDLESGAASTLISGLPIANPGEIEIGNGTPLVGQDLVLADLNTEITSPCCHGAVFRIDRQTGDATALALGNPSFPAPGDPYGLAFGPGGAFGQDLFVMDLEGTSPNPPVLYTVDQGGSSEFLVSPGSWTTDRLPAVMDFDSTGNYGGHLYILDSSNLGGAPAIWRVTDQAALSVFVQGPLVAPGGIDFGSGGTFGALMYVLDVGVTPATSTIFTADASGALTTFATGLPSMDATLGFVPPAGLAFAPDGQSLFVLLEDEVHVIRPTGVTSYCTAGTSASGCQALLCASGQPSATAASGFVVSAASVEGSKDGLYFFGTNGQQANSWGNGTSFQCVVPPVKRAGVLSGTGTVGQCDGAFAQDFNAYWTAKPAANPGPGVLVQLQLWYRDPLSTSNQTTSLSDALEFTVGS